MGEFDLYWKKLSKGDKQVITATFTSLRLLIFFNRYGLIKVTRRRKQCVLYFYLYTCTDTKLLERRKSGQEHRSGGERNEAEQSRGEQNKARGSRERRRGTRESRTERRGTSGSRTERREARGSRTERRGAGGSEGGQGRPGRGGAGRRGESWSRLGRRNAIESRSCTKMNRNKLAIWNYNVVTDMSEYKQIGSGQEQKKCTKVEHFSGE